MISGPAPLARVPTAAEGAADDECCLQANTTLAAPAAAGSNQLRVNNVMGFFTGKTVTLGRGDGQEAARVDSVGTAASSTTKAAPVAAGDTNVKVASVANLVAGAPTASR